MKAIRIHFADHGNELRMEEVPQPNPKADEVMIRTQAIGVNRADLGRRRTVSAGEQEPPRIPGLDVAGVVASVGANVTNWHPGDHAMALVRGAYAEYAVAQSALIFRPPVGMSTTDAASLPCVFFTAWYAFQMAELKRGETALIQAAGANRFRITLWDRELAQAAVDNNQPSRRRYTMAITLHHLIVPAQDKLASAQLFAEIFGLTVKPAEGRFAQVPVDEHLTIDFADDEHTRGILHFVPEQLESHHYAFHVTDEEFDGIFGRVKAKGLAYGSGPTSDTDGRVADRRGGRAFYFRELNGHLLEVMTA